MPISAPKHRALHRAPVHQHPREKTAARGYGERWRKARAAYLARHPLCVDCEREHRLVTATVVDHIEAHKGNARLFWSEANWQSLCKQHHDRKTATHDGGFGR